MKRPHLSLLNACIHGRILGVMLLVLLLTDPVQAQKGKDNAAKEEVITDTIACESSPPSPLTYIIQNLKYPEQARINGIKGTAIIKFYIEVDGRLTELRFEKTLSPECNAEVRRVFMRAPRWEPQEIDGKCKRVGMVATIEFSPESVHLVRIGPVQAQTDSCDNNLRPDQIDPNIHINYWEEPIFPNYAQYIKVNLFYPEKARKEGRMGNVILKFVVETDGSLSNFKIEKSLSPECDAEVLRLFQNMPRWQPGKYDGVLERSAYMVTIRFPQE